MNRFDKENIAANFDRAAADYDQHAVLQKKIAERLVARLDFVTVRPEQIIDIGSGTGTTSGFLARKYRNARVVQLDLSQMMLRKSRRKGAWFFSRQHYICGDAEYLPIAPGMMDMVFSSLAYQWCNDLDLAFGEAKRILRPNGLFIFATLGPDTLKELRESWAAADAAMHVHTFFDMHDIGDALVRAGMEGVVMDVESVTMTYPDCIGLMRDLKDLGSRNASLDRQGGLTGKGKLKQMLAAYEKYRQEGKLPATYEIVYGHAWAPAHGRSEQSGRIAYVPVDTLRSRRQVK